MQDIQVKSEWDGFAGLIGRLDQLHSDTAAVEGGVRLGSIDVVAKSEPGSTLPEPGGGPLVGQDVTLKKTLSALESELQAYTRRRPGTSPSARRPVEGSSRRPVPGDSPASSGAGVEFVKLALEFVKLAQVKEPGLKEEIALLRAELAKAAPRISQLSMTGPGEGSSEGARAGLLHKVEALTEKIGGVASSKSIEGLAMRLSGVETQLNAVASTLSAIPSPLREAMVRDLAPGFEALKSELGAKLSCDPASAQDVAELKLALFESFAKLHGGQEERLCRFEERTENLRQVISMEILGHIEKTAKNYDCSARLEKKLNELAEGWAEVRERAGGPEAGKDIAAEMGETISKLIARQEEETGRLRQGLGAIEAEIRKLVTKMARLETELRLPAGPLPLPSDEAEALCIEPKPRQAELMPSLFPGAALGLIEPGCGYPDDPLARPDVGTSQEEREQLGSSLILRLKRLMKRVKKPSGLTLLALLILGAAYNHLEDSQVVRRLGHPQAAPHANNALETSRPEPGETARRPETADIGTKTPTSPFASEVFDQHVLGPSLQAGGKLNSQQIAGADKITAAALLPSALPLAPDSGRDQARSSFSRDFLEMKARAEDGNPVAQYEIAQHFVSGQGVPQDYAQAMAFFEKAAKQGLAPAQFRLASIYEKGLGTSKNPKTAAFWYQRAAESGNVHAMHNLGVLLAEGLEGRPDYAKAAFWFSQAAAYGEGDSQFNLAVLLDRGLGLPRDPAKSYAWFAIAATLGDAEAAEKRDETGLKLSMEDLQTAHRFAQSYLARPRDRAANEIDSPPGGFNSSMPVVAKNAVF